MTESQRSTGPTNPLAGRVTIHEKPDYTAVKFTLGNQTETQIGVEFEQTVQQQALFDFMSKYHGDDWTVTEDGLTFETDIDGESAIQTVYAVKGISPDSVRTSLTEATVTVFDASDELLGRVNGLNPTVVEEHPDQSANETDEQTTGGGSGTETTGGRSGTETGTATQSDTETEVAWQSGETAAPQETDSSSSSGQASRSEAAGEKSLSEIAEKPSGDVDATLDEIARGEHAGDHTESGGDHTESGGDHTESTSTGEIEMQSIGDTQNGTATDSEAGPERGAEPPRDDLPATRADYILVEVRGEIESAAEFEWVQLDPGRHSAAREIITRIKSWIGLGQ